MKRILSAAAIASTAALTALPSDAQEAAPVLFVVTSADAQTQLMSMVLTMQSAQQVAAARVLLCGPAGDMALRDAPDSVTQGQPPRDMSPQGLMQMVMDKTGATVEVCAIYLPGRGADASVLLDGVGVADPAEIGAIIADPRSKVVGF